jgi:hypothetical protein
MPNRNQTPADRKRVLADALIDLAEQLDSASALLNTPGTDALADTQIARWKSLARALHTTRLLIEASRPTG